MLLQDWIASKPDLVATEQLEQMDRFSYLENCISPYVRITDDVSSRIQMARLVLTGLKPLWRRRDIRLSTKGREIDIVLRLQNMTFESKIYVKNFGV